MVELLIRVLHRCRQWIETYYSKDRDYRDHPTLLSRASRAERVSTSCTVNLTKSAGSIVASSVKAAVEKEVPERSWLDRKCWCKGVCARVLD